MARAVEASPPPARGRRWLVGPWPGVLLGLLCFANSLSNDFVYDDLSLIVDNPRIRSLTDFRGVWLSDWWYPIEGTTYANPRRDRLYRPLTLCTFALNYAVHELRPFGYHAFNVALHGVACGLLWYFVRRMAREPTVATLAAVLFAVHPVHAEAVANVVGRAEILAAIFLLAGLLVLTGGRRPVLRALAAAPLFLLALLAKETAICYPAVAGLAVWLRRRGSGERRLRWLVPLLILLLPLAVYLPVRYEVLEHRLVRAPGVGGVWMNPLMTASLSERVVGVFTILGHYTRLLVLPARLSADYGYAIVDPQAGFVPITGLGVAAAGALLAALFGFRRRGDVWPAAALWGAVFLASYALISNSALRIGVTLAERLMYWPSVPLLALAAVLILAFWRRQCQPGQPLARSARLVRVLGLLLVGAFALRTAVRNMDWADNLSLAGADVRTYPQGAHLNRGYADALIRLAEHNPDRSFQRATLELAEKHLIRASELDPSNAEVLALRARIRAAFGDIDKAYLYAEGALVLHPMLPDALYVLARLKGSEDSEERRFENLRAAAATQPANPAVWLECGGAALDAGKPYLALEPLEKAAALAPDDPNVALRLGETYALLGEADAAVTQYRKILSRTPEDWSAHANLYTLLAERDPRTALTHAQRAHQLRPNDIRTQVNLAEVCTTLGRKTEALEMYRRIVQRLDADDPFRAVVAKRIEFLARK